MVMQRVGDEVEKLKKQMGQDFLEELEVQKEIMRKEMQKEMDIEYDSRIREYINYVEAGSS